MTIKPLNIFYDEPDNDRWFKYDRYPRMVLRRILRGKKRPGGVGMIVVNLKKGLDALGVPYRFNDYAYINKHQNEIACIIGMPFLLFNKKWKNPVIFGAAIYSHPVERPALLSEYPNIQKVLVPGEWMRHMFEPYYPNKTVAWPAGIDTHKWSPEIKESRSVDFLIYDKIRWEHASFQESLIDPICQTLANRGFSYEFIRYGHYKPEDLLNKIKHAGAVIFLCEHETQGLAYQQILATGTPILAWERGGYWQDPYYFPHKAMFEPVSATPYWDQRCGMKFNHIDEFDDRLVAFMKLRDTFRPDEYVKENLSLEISAQKYLDIYQDVLKSLP